MKLNHAIQVHPSPEIASDHIDSKISFEVVFSSKKAGFQSSPRKKNDTLSSRYQRPSDYTVHDCKSALSRARFSVALSPRKSAWPASSEANRLEPAAAAPPSPTAGASSAAPAAAAAAARSARAPPDVASSCAAFSLARRSTDAGKPTISATWMPKEVGHAPSRTWGTGGGGGGRQGAEPLAQMLLLLLLGSAPQRAS